MPITSLSADGRAPHDDIHSHCHHQRNHLLGTGNHLKTSILKTRYTLQATSKKAAKKAAAQSAAEGLYGVQYPDLPYGYKTAALGQEGQPKEEVAQQIPTL